MLQLLAAEHAALWLTLEERDREILIALGKGATDREIAAKLLCTRKLVIRQMTKLRREARLNRLEMAIMGYLWNAAYRQSQLASESISES